jgi:serine/threonine protein kinase
MALAVGDKLGPYEVVTPLGAGGMGEVYKARDTRLGRFVAIKVLPEHISTRADLRQRFEREARIVASLNTRVVKESSGSGVELKQAAESVATANGPALGIYRYVWRRE